MTVLRARHVSKLPRRHHVAQTRPPRRALWVLVPLVALCGGGIVLASVPQARALSPFVKLRDPNVGDFFAELMTRLGLARAVTPTSAPVSTTRSDLAALAPPPEARPSGASYTVASAGVVSSGAAPASLAQEMMGRAQVLVQRCYESELTHLPALAGGLTVELHVNGLGRVHATRVNDSTLPSPTVAGCALRALEDLVFPAQSGNVMLTYYWRFEQRAPTLAASMRPPESPDAPARQLKPGKRPDLERSAQRAERRAKRRAAFAARPRTLTH